MTRRGFTLIELLCIIALLAIIGLVMVLLLREAFEIERMQAATFNRMLETNALADQFRADVAAAEIALPEWQDYNAGKQTLILRMKAGDHIVYRWEDGRLWRRAFKKAGFTERPLPVGVQAAKVEFLGPAPGLNVLRLRVHLTRGESIVPGKSIEIAAGLTGDFR